MVVTHDCGFGRWGEQCLLPRCKSSSRPEGRRYQCLPGKLRMPANTIGSVDTLFYVDKLVLPHEAPPDQVQLILGAAMKTVAKGIEAEKWLGGLCQANGVRRGKDRC